ncbi:type II toxin-antitoxin system Phd/YefM family antitoxin [Candidatus Daviesbacteria bacterium]|nr:type II toxin-antitoxin system Phd/YefM family antitoxin [Candidatus Daviesbacteria bacterium]
MQLSNILDKKFIGTNDLRKDLTSILNLLPKEGKIVITQHGRPKGVLIDIETYMKIEELKDDLADYDPKLVREVNKALDDVKKHGGIPAEKVWEELGI